MSRFSRIIPLLDRVLVEKVVAPTKSAGGVLLPETNHKMLNHGHIVAVGTGLRNSRTGEMMPLSVKAGDKVLLPEFGGTQIKLEDGKEYFMYRDEDILAKLE